LGQLLGPASRQLLLLLVLALVQVLVLVLPSRLRAAWGCR
jgi:hypothetical protein